MYDCAVIGTGPAGISAALTLRALGVGFVWFGSAALSSKIRSVELIRNFPALPSVSGEKLQKAFLEQIKEAELTITERTVTGIYPEGGGFGILAGEEYYGAKAVILATGVEAVKPMKGEPELLGRGVSYCATCDGALYKNKTIAVVATSKDYEHEAEFLASIAEKVYFVPLYKNPQIKAGNVEIVKGAPVEVRGGARVEALVFRDKALTVDGVFLLKNSAPPSVLVKGLQTENGSVAVTRACETNIKGVFAAGDCTGRPYQYAKAAGEGNVAAHSVHAFLAQSR